MQDDETLTCLRCGARNSSLVTHCYYCGDRLERTCRHCGHPNPPDVKYYCEYCEKPLNGSQKEAATGSTESDQDAAQSVHETEVETTKEPSETAQVLDVGVCPRCKHSYQPGSTYCSNCGLLLDDEKAPDTSSNIGAFQLGSPGGFWVRVGAATLDYFVVHSINLIVAVLSGVGILEFLGAGILDSIDPESPGYSLEQLNNVEWILVVVNWVVYIVYAPILIGLWSTTIGKRPFNLRVVKADGGRCGFWRALARESAKFFSAAILGVGYLMVAFRDDRRGLHDLIAGTAVIKRSE